MPPMRRVCDFHGSSPKGCRNGTSCRFLHVGPAGAASSNPSPKPRPALGTARPWLSTLNASVPRPGDLPAGACSEFWTKGQCERSFECRFRHLRPTDHQTQTTAPAQAGAPLNPFLKTSALDRISTASDAFSLTSRNLKPSEAHNHLKLFLRDGYEFRTSQNMHSFATILSSANSESGAWKLSEGQSFLSLIAKAGGNGVLLMGRILRHENVSTEAHAAADTLSFQRGYLPLFAYLSSDFVIKSTMHHDVNSLYSVVDINFDRIAEVLIQCLADFTDAYSFADPLGGPTLPGAQVFRSITTVLTEYITRYKRAVMTHPHVRHVIERLSTTFKIWDQGVNRGLWEDPISALSPGETNFVLRSLRQGVDSLIEIVDLAEGRTIRRRPGLQATPNLLSQGILTRLDLTYVGPGHERRGGPRHDNDHTDISEIRIVPTYQELICDESPYLPSNIPGARHHLPSDSMARLVDIQFRLLREELVAPVKSSINLIMEDLRASPTTKTQLNDILRKRGGLYAGSKHSLDAVRFQVYTNVGFGGISCDQRHGLSVDLTLDSPNGGARHREKADRKDWWKNEGKKRLNQGGLVAMIWRSGSDPSAVGIYLGVVSSSDVFLGRSVEESQDRIHIRVSFFDKEVEFKILQVLQQRSPREQDMRFLIEAPVMLESIRPFLDTLRQITPSLIPFSKYLAHPNSGSLKHVAREPPLYATRPGFLMDLSSLFPKGHRGVFLRPTDPDSAQMAREALKQRTTLDPSQADAIVDSLTSEISLIQGPPGTGKSFTGVELIKVLLANEIKPIVLIAFTNQALDHLILDVVKKGITESVVRLGSHSKNDVVKEFSLEGILAARSGERSQAKRAEGAAFRELKDAEELMKELMEQIQAKYVKTSEAQLYVKIRYPNHHREVDLPPLWIKEVFEGERGWSGAAESMLDFWRLAKDLDFIDPPVPAAPTNRNHKKSAAEATSKNRFGVLPEEEGVKANRPGPTTQDGISQADPHPLSAKRFFRDLHLTMPPVPSTNRPVSLLQGDHHVWRMSRQERKRLFKHWGDEVRSAAYRDQADEFVALRDAHAEMRTQHENALNQIKLDVLQDADLIGCTTNGAAKLTSLLRSLQPKILLVEEAGQVLEAHILASLVPSVQSMVLIGDPQQLRPTLVNYHLSVDCPNTGKIYRFDQSLMERLSSTGYHMSQLKVQRRMRPQISQLVRQTLYHNLEDHPLVRDHPDVQGLAKNVFFLTHEHAEGGGGEDSVSKTNSFEVGMVKDLVMHLLRQGPYSGEGGIVVLCAYLGQLVKIKRALSGLVTTVIDERDQDQIAAYEGNPEVVGILNQTVVEEHDVTKRVTIRTVDNFQGEEADVVILSLVRNSGGGGGGSGKTGIGFLKSKNRSNVALSRAKHGLFILGNAADLAAQSEMWSTVVDELRKQDCVGDGFPISCSQHPGNPVIIREPGMMPRFAPDGGCLLPCTSQLRCGHLCPSKCHGDDRGHLSIRCTKDCQKLCKRLHPCPKRCANPCGQCRFQMTYTLPICGHKNMVFCYQLDTPQNIVCQHHVTKKLPGCEHSAVMECGQDASQYDCKTRCDILLPCCSKPCTGQCGECQQLNPSPTDEKEIPRQIHARHPCARPLYCQHACNEDCATDHDCSSTICRGQCYQNCSHRRCDQPCAEPCPPCVEPVCDWRCDHFQCPVACGSVCARLPCDKRCSIPLDCGHRCPSVCGEDCSSQICPSCASFQEGSQVVDLIMGVTMEQVDPHGEELDDILVTLACRHVFTVETLDGTCHLSDYYTRENGVWTGLAQPPESLQKPPVCPTCRGPISARRYGRVFKRARLDMLEQHIANSAHRQIHEALQLRAGFNLSAARTSAIGLRTSLADTPEDHESFAHLASIRGELLSAQSSLPLSPMVLGLNIGKHFPLPDILKSFWLRTVKPLLRAYSETYRVAELRSSNYSAYEAAFATLYRVHLDNLSDTALWHSPEDVAHEKARVGCGQAPPRADMRFRVEAIWASVEIRFDLVKVARAILKSLWKRGENSRMVPDTVWKNWAKFVIFIHESSCNDCHIAIRLAKESNSHRQVVKSTLLLLRVKFERFVDRSQQHLAATTNRSESCNTLADKALAYTSNAKRVAAETARTYRIAVSGALAQQEWLQREFSSVVDVIVDQWSEQAYKLRRDTFYEPVKLGEMEQIVRAFSSGFHGFSTRGHWYTCPQGHVYVIGECGGATQRSFCPECGAAIGGSSHQLESSNHQATQMEAISRDIGLGASPWSWGAGA